MKLTIYCTRESFEKLFEETATQRQKENREEHPKYFSWGGFNEIDSSTVSCETDSIARLPRYVDKLQVTKAEINALLYQEQSRQVRQGWGKTDDGASYTVERGFEKVVVGGHGGDYSSGSNYHRMVPVFDIDIVGPSIESVVNCYDLIRSGKSAENWDSPTRPTIEPDRPEEIEAVEYDESEA